MNCGAEFVIVLGFNFNAKSHAGLAATCAGQPGLAAVFLHRNASGASTCGSSAPQCPASRWAAQGS